MKAKSNVKSKAPKIEGSAGDWVESNVWFKIGLGRSEAAMLKTIGARIFVGKPTSASVARELLRAALAHYDKIELLMTHAARYADHEGFCQDIYSHGLIKHQHAALLDLAKGKHK